MLLTANIIFVAQETIYSENGGTSSLEYFLRSHTGPDGETQYGMRIDMRNPDGELLERDETAGLSASITDVAELAEAFAKGTVRPSYLHEMVEECFCLETKKFMPFFV